MIDIMQYYYDLDNVYKTLTDFTLEYSERYSNEASRAQQKLLQYIQSEMSRVEKEMKNNFRSDNV